MTTTFTAGQDLAELRAWVNGWPAFVASGVTCDELGPGYVQAHMQVPEGLHNPSGALNGGVLAFFADQMGGTVASSLVAADRGPVTTTLTVNYLAGARGDLLDGVARVVRTGRSLAFVEIEVHAQERLCLTASGVWLLTSPR